MATKGTVSVVILWEHELRTAAHALSLITPEAKAADPEKWAALVVNAANVCLCALQGVAENPERPMILCGDSAIKHQPREIEVKQIVKKEAADANRD